MLILSLSILYLVSVSSKFLTPDLGWYTVAYEGLSLKHFYTKVDKLSSITLTGCNCPGDQFVLLDNGIPLTFLNNCYQTVPGPISCELAISDPLECLNIGSIGKKFISFEKIGVTDKMITQPPPPIFYCSLGGYIFPGEHNITVIVSNAFYPFNEAYIRVDSVCHNNSGQTLPCCAVNNTITSSQSCVDAIVG